MSIAYGWQEREIFQNKGKNKIEEWQSERCPKCGKYLTTPYMYYFYNHNFCPNCGAKLVKDVADDLAETLNN